MSLAKLPLAILPITCSSTTIVTRCRTFTRQSRLQSTTSKTPSQMKSHMQWVKGTVSEKIGSMVGSDKMKANGAVARAEGITQMRAAKAATDSKVYSRVEKHSAVVVLKTEGKSQGLVGKMFQCEGMKERGNLKVEAAQRKKNDTTDL